MALKPTSIRLINARSSTARAVSRSMTALIASGILLIAAASAQTTELRSETGPEPKSEKARAPQAAIGPVDHHHLGFHDHEHGPHHPLMSWMLRRLDTDRDGSVSRAELTSAHERQVALFEKADLDHDGKVTADELRAFQSRRWKERRPDQQNEGRPAPAPK